MSTPVDAEEAVVARLLREWDSFARDLRERRPATAETCVELASALATVLGSPDDPVPVAGWFEVGEQDGRVRVRMPEAATARLYDAFTLVDDPAVLRTVIRLSLDTGTQLQRVRGGNAAASALVDCAAMIVPVLEAVGSGLHPVVGAAATVLKHHGEQLADSTEARQRIDRWLSTMDGQELASAVRGLIALAETLLVDEDAVDAGRMLLGAAITATTPGRTSR